MASTPRSWCGSCGATRSTRLSAVSAHRPRRAPVGLVCGANSLRCSIWTRSRRSCERLCFVVIQLGRGFPPSGLPSVGLLAVGLLDLIGDEAQVMGGAGAAPHALASRIHFSLSAAVDDLVAPGVCRSRKLRLGGNLLG